MVSCAGNLEAGEVDVRLGIFHGDSLSNLVFLLGLIPICLLQRKDQGSS